MKTLLLTTMALGVVFMLGANQSSNAMILQTFPGQVVVVGGYHPGFWGGPVYGPVYRTDSFYYDNRPLIRVGPLGLF